MKGFSADDLVKIIAACGQAGVSRIKWAGVEIVLDTEELVMIETKEDEAPSVRSPSRIHYEPKQEKEDFPDDLVLTDPDAWAALGGGDR